MINYMFALCNYILLLTILARVRKYIAILIIYYIILSFLLFPSKSYDMNL